MFALLLTVALTVIVLIIAAYYGNNQSVRFATYVILPSIITALLTSGYPDGIGIVMTFVIISLGTLIAEVSIPRSEVVLYLVSILGYSYRHSVIEDVAYLRMIIYNLGVLFATFGLASLKRRSL